MPAASTAESTSQATKARPYGRRPTASSRSPAHSTIAAPAADGEPVAVPAEQPPVAVPPPIVAEEPPSAGAETTAPSGTPSTETGEAANANVDDVPAAPAEAAPPSSIAEE